MFDHSYYQEIERPRIDKMIAFIGDHLNDIHTTEHVIDDLKNKGFFLDKFICKNIFINIKEGITYGSFSRWCR